jgi:pSer/pThr/pTyr-binding forkhead associated (FHA) protein
MATCGATFWVLKRRPSLAVTPHRVSPAVEGHAASASPIEGRLEVVSAPGRVVSPTFSGTRAVSLGRHAQHDIVIDDEQVSGLHAVIEWSGDRWVLSDINSRNGTFVNGVRATRAPLNAGDLVQVGQTQLRFQAEAKRSL